MNTNKRQLRPYHGIILLVLFAVVLFIVAPLITRGLGMYGSLVGELLFLLLALGFAAATRADFKLVFPLQKPKLAATFGSLLLWGGIYSGGMVISVLFLYLFPEQAAGAEQVAQSYTSLPFLLSVLVIAIAPAVCEEAIFRGVLMRSLSPLRRKWLVIVIVGVIFGAFHADWMKFIPTALLGILFGYVVWETNNIFYSVLLHFINNMLAVVTLYIVQLLTRAMPAGGIDMAGAALTQIPLISVGIYMMMALSVPFLLYIGNYLLHKGIPGAPARLFPGEKRTVLYILIGITVFLFLLAVFVCVLSVLVDGDILRELLQQAY